jgi:1-deoxy-D-xylulose-5-phosphate reductoisomerase
LRRIVLLGATGSIGRQALDVIARSPDLELAGLSAHSTWAPLVDEGRRHGARRIALADPAAAREAAAAWPEAEVLSGPDAATELAATTDADLVLNAIVGAAGLGPTIATIESGKQLGLANKESLVVGGSLVMDLARRAGTRIVPVDSEHSALDQLIGAGPPDAVERLVVTASGGPFRGRSPEEVAQASVEDALAHPTWSMGVKNTIDSATLMNKGLEVIEAHHLFGIPYERIDVLVHPTSIVHGLVTLTDGAVLAHLGTPDMRMPISYALHFPQRVDVGVATLDLVAASPLVFEPVDDRIAPCLRIAIAAAQTGGTATCVLNAANEVAVAEFVEGRLRFGDIAAVVEETLERLPAQPADSVGTLLEADAEARATARECTLARR